MAEVSQINQEFVIVQILGTKNDQDIVFQVSVKIASPLPKQGIKNIEVKVDEFERNIPVQEVIRLC